jgi:hypothetical protein
VWAERTAVHVSKAIHVSQASEKLHW